MMQPRCRALIPIVLALLAPLASAAAAERAESQQEYWAKIDHHDWAAAITAAQALVATSRSGAAQHPLELAEALSLLGHAQLGAGDHASAEASYSEALALAEQHGGAMSASVLDPLRGLGYALAASGRHAAAAPVLESALIITHRNFGLFDIRQENVLRQLATSLMKIGRASDAQRHMNYLRRVAEQTYGRTDPRLAPVLSMMGEWYADAGNFPLARESYRDAVEIVRRRLGRSNIAAVEPLRGLARTHTQELLYSTLGLEIARARVPTSADGKSNEHMMLNPRYLSSEGENALERALRIIEAQPDPPQAMLVDTLIQLGDWRQLKNQSEQAHTFYRRAAALVASRAAAQPDGDRAEKDEQSSRLAFPVRLYYPTPWLASRNAFLPADAVDETFVRVEFNVTGRGEVADARIADTNGTARQGADALAAIRAARYRPRFVNGEPADTPNVAHREIFRTRKTEQETDSSEGG